MILKLPGHHRPEFRPVYFELPKGNTNQTNSHKDFGLKTISNQ